MAVAPSAETVKRRLVLNQTAFLYEGKLYGKLGTPRVLMTFLCMGR